MYSYNNYSLRLSTGMTIVTSHFGSPKVFVIKDLLRSEQGNESFVIVTKNKVLHTISTKECDLVPNKKQLDAILKDKKQYIEYLRRIDKLVENNKLRPSKKNIVKEVV